MAVPDRLCIGSNKQIMEQKDKDLYNKIKAKHYANFNRIVKRVFAKHFKNLENRNQKDADLIGAFLTVFEMDIKYELKKAGTIRQK